MRETKGLGMTTSEERPRATSLVIEDEVDLGRKTNAIISYYSKWSGGAGLIPVPFADVATIACVQLKMLSALSELHAVPFETHRGRAIVMAVLGAAAPGSLAMGAAGTAIRAVPVLGPLLSVATLPAFAAASTYAVGSVFARHLSHGGSMLDIDVESMKDAVAQHYAARTAKPAEA